MITLNSKLEQEFTTKYGKRFVDELKKDIEYYNGLKPNRYCTTPYCEICPHHFAEWEDRTRVDERLVCGLAGSPDGDPWDDTPWKCKMEFDYETQKQAYEEVVEWWVEKGL